MTDTAHDPDLDHLPPTSASLASILGRPKLVAIACVVALAGLGWIYLGLLIAEMIGTGHAQAVGGLFAALAQPGGLGAVGHALVAALCGPTFGSAVHGATGGAAFAPLDLALTFSMWCAMVLAMMLPSGAPMIVTYAEIADTAARKGERVASPLALAAGYLVVWLGFALAATALQAAATAAGFLDPAMATASPLFSGAIFIGAGAYQFSALKHACLTACQRPFPFFFINWTTVPAGIFRLGLRQGLTCVGCCWAMMLVMFALGVMNVVWMAALGFIMAAEKLSATTRLSKAIGGALIAIGIAFVTTSFIAHWPARAG